MNSSIRKARKEDIGAIVNLYAKATRLMFELSPRGFGKRLGEVLDLDKEGENFTKLLDDDSSIVLVAEIDGSVAGFVMGAVEDYPDDLLDSPYMTVQYICVDERFRKKGVGQALMLEIEKRVKDRGITDIDLMVWDTNKPARRLFEKLGFVALNIRMGKKIKD